MTCKQKETGDTFYISINDSSYSSFLAYPAPGNKLRKYLPEINKLKTKSGEVLLATKMVEGEHILRGTVPSHYKNNPDLFNSSHSMNENSLKYATSNCKSLPKNFSEDIYNKLKSDRENATMVSYVEFIDRNLEGLLVNPEYLPAVVCMYNGSYYTPEAYNQMKKALELDSSIVDLKKAKELFNKAKKRKDIAWNYKIDGCYARAHLMARMFEKEGIKVEKAWARGHLLIPGTNNLSWGYHVAPAVLVKQKDGSVEKMIIDPSIASEPVKASEWLKIMGVSQDKVLNTGYPSPLNSDMYKKVSLSYSSPDAYWPSYNEISEEDKMNAAKDTMEEYLQY